MTLLNRCAPVLLAMCATLSASAASAQGTRVITASPATLGSIPNGVSQRDVPFTVTDRGLVRNVSVSMALTHPSVGDLTVILLAPDGATYYLMSWGTVKPFTALNGVYAFADTATATFVSVAYGAAPTVPPGTYLPDFGTRSIDATFAGRTADGLWTLRLLDVNGANVTGAISAASLTITMTPGTRVAADGSTLGAIPDGPSGRAQTPGAPRDVTFTVPQTPGVVRAVSVSMTLAHPFLGDVLVRLIAPNGVEHVIFGYTGATSTGLGYGKTLNNTYIFEDGAVANFWNTASVSTDIPPGAYRTSTIGGSPSGGTVTSMDAALAGVPLAGTWTLRLTDGAAGDVGSISAARLSLTGAAAPTTVGDTFSGTYGTPLAVPAPGLLANDHDNLGGAMTASLVSSPAHGTAAVAPSGAVTYTPAPGFAGSDTFTYRATNVDGAGNVATVSVTVPPPTTVQPPLDVRASSVDGNTITLRWTLAPGPVATSFLMEGGVAPGQVLASIPTGSPLPIFTFDAPSGVFYLRMRALAGGIASGVSNEIRVFVQTAAPPSAPDSLTGVVNGDTVGLSWRNTFAGGAPASQQIVVTGAATAVLPLPLGESFSFAGVPGGSYTFRVRATNVIGTSGDSNAVSLTFPTSCAGAPAPPPNFLAFAVGNVVHLLWDPPAAGEAAGTGYVITVGGSLNAAVPVPVRAISAPLPSGAYTFAVASTNVCGTGAATAPQTVFIP